MLMSRGHFPACPHILCFEELAHFGQNPKRQGLCMMRGARALRREEGGKTLSAPLATLLHQSLDYSVRSRSASWLVLLRSHSRAVAGVLASSKVV